MHRDDEVESAVVIEEWLLHVRGPGDLEDARVAEAHDLVRAALLTTVAALQPQLDALGVHLQLMTPDSSGPASARPR
ncbi:MAG: hypothetical protein ABR549_15695 [Mycobacteriales bacterium]